MAVKHRYVSQTRSDARKQYITIHTAVHLPSAVEWWEYEFHWSTLHGIVCQSTFVYSDGTKAPAFFCIGRMRKIDSIAERSSRQPREIMSKTRTTPPQHHLIYAFFHVQLKITY